jgi:hypothetical protein
MDAIERLLQSQEPSIRFLARVGVLGEDPGSKEVQTLRGEIRDSPRAKALLSERNDKGRIEFGVYSKWRGAHWVIGTLADIGYPPGDPELMPLIDQTLYCWLGKSHLDSVQLIDGRARRCGSQEGNALWSSLTLGVSDERTDQLASNLIGWQWPDGGWNCDRKPEATKSSFHETLFPLRALSLHARLTGSQASAQAAQKAAEPFLSRHMMRRLSSGKMIRAEFSRLQYPAYWHYDVLSGLRVMAEAGFIGDPRCEDALDWLESKRLPDGGFPATFAYYRANSSTASWGGTGVNKMNEWVTVHALTVLRAAGRL